MGINRSRRVRSLGYQRDKFSSARLTSAKYEARTLHHLVDEDMDHLYDDVDTGLPEATVIGLPDDVLYEMGILYDAPTVEVEILVVDNAGFSVADRELETERETEPEPDWDMVSEVSEWDVVGLDDGGYSDSESWD